MTLTQYLLLAVFYALLFLAIGRAARWTYYTTRRRGRTR